MSVYDSGVRCPPAFEPVIFDNDGVLVDSEPHAQRVAAALLTECGWPMTPEDYFAMFLGHSLASVRARAEAHLGRRFRAILRTASTPASSSDSGRRALVVYYPHRRRPSSGTAFPGLMRRNECLRGRRASERSAGPSRAVESWPASSAAPSRSVHPPTHF